MPLLHLSKRGIAPELSSPWRTRGGRELTELVLVVVALLATATQLQAATTFVSNTGQPDVAIGHYSHTDHRAQQFTTGNHAAGYRFSAIVIDIGRFCSIPSAFALHQSITDANGLEVPGTKLVDLTSSYSSSGEKNFTPAHATILARASKYFVVIKTAAPAGILDCKVHRTLSTNIDSGTASGWDIAEHAVLSLDSGSTWTNRPGLHDPPPAIQIAVTGTIVPTPPPVTVSNDEHGATESCPYTPSDPIEEQRDVLILLYCATDGPNWKNKSNWLTESAIDDWRGVTASGEEVTTLILANNRLKGGIPATMGNLTNLEILSLDDNQLSGTIPTELGNLTNLEFLYLNDNQLSGTIPTELRSLSNLEDLQLDGNQLSGTIPEELGNLTSIQSLYLNDNQLSGTIPTELKNLTNLQHLFLSDNALLEGTLPLVLTELSKLKTLDIENTGICAPLDEVFQQWLDTIDDFTGSDCPETEPESLEDTEQTSVAGQGDVGCTTSSNTKTGDIPQEAVLNLLLIISALLVVPWRGIRKTERT